MQAHSRSNKRSRGNDEIPDFVLGKTGFVTCKFLTILINHCLNIEYFPLNWREAVEVLIPKSYLDSKDSCNYRTISPFVIFGETFGMGGAYGNKTKYIVERDLEVLTICI